MPLCCSILIKPSLVVTTSPKKYWCLHTGIITVYLRCICLTSTQAKQYVLRTSSQAGAHVEAPDTMHTICSRLVLVQAGPTYSLMKMHRHGHHVVPVAQQACLQHLRKRPGPRVQLVPQHVHNNPANKLHHPTVSLSTQEHTKRHVSRATRQPFLHVQLQHH